MSSQITSNDIEALRKGKRGMQSFRIKLFSDVFPWLLIPVVVYNLIALLSDGVGPDGTPAIRSILEDSAMRIPMLSDVTMWLSWGDLFLIFTIIFLFVEVIKSTSTSSPTIVNHIFSMVLFVACLMQFLMFASFATGTYFVLTCIILLDALAGMVVTIVSARRDFGVEGIGQ